MINITRTDWMLNRSFASYAKVTIISVNIESSCKQTDKQQTPMKTLPPSRRFLCLLSLCLVKIQCWKNCFPTSLQDTPHSFHLGYSLWIRLGLIMVFPITFADLSVFEFVVKVGMSVRKVLCEVGRCLHAFVYISCVCGLAFTVDTCEIAPDFSSPVYLISKPRTVGRRSWTCSHLSPSHSLTACCVHTLWLRVRGES